MIKNIFPFPTYIESEVNRLFAEKKWSQLPKSLAEDVLQLSDFYIHNPDSPTPWEKEWAQRAGLVYFWPLNTLRLLKIKSELINQNFFQNLKYMLDYGAGVGTASWALQDQFPKPQLFERSSIPQRFFPNFHWIEKPQVGPHSLTVFSYSLTELESLPDWIFESEALLIIEPSTQQDGRKLLELRQQLIEKNYFIWAPCPHQLACPLLSQSKTDWCHDRVLIEKPSWFENMEKYLPMKNNTLTFSYLAARKTPPIAKTWSRLVGDPLHEKGKTRQLICRGSDREFLSWMLRNGEAPELSRGDRIYVDGFEKKSNELRSLKIRRHD